MTEEPQKCLGAYTIEEGLSQIPYGKAVPKEKSIANMSFPFCFFWPKGSKVQISQLKKKAEIPSTFLGPC